MPLKAKTKKNQTKQNQSLLKKCAIIKRIIWLLKNTDKKK